MPPVRLSRLASRERAVVGLLRGADTRGGVAAPSPFLTLRDRAIGAGFVLLEPTSEYASRHELCLLALVGLLQRRHPDLLARVPTPLEEALRSCAACLDDRGWHLAPTTVRRLSGLDDALREMAVEIVPTHSLTAAKADRRRSPDDRPRITFAVKRRLGVDDGMQLRRPRLGVPRARSRVSSTVSHG